MGPRQECLREMPTWFNESRARVKWHEAPLPKGAGRSRRDVSSGSIYLTVGR
jgi:hypothetical protein